MIYLIDDNRKRQQDSGWSNEKFEEYKDFIQPIYRLSEVTDNLRFEIFRNDKNVILYHESFFENSENKQSKDVNEIRNELEKNAYEEKMGFFVNFSGSNSERRLNNNKSASLPVHILYKNLEFFIKEFQKGNFYNLKYLLYGSNPDIENFLLEELDKVNRLFIEDKSTTGNEINDSFIFRSRFDFNHINDNHITIFNKDSEFGFHNLIIKSLSKIEYKSIFVPLCFGNSLSDFNGLRLATEIRCTNTINQCKPIFIYTFVGLEYFFNNEYFNILKTKGVEKIDYSKKSFLHSTNRSLKSLSSDELTKELKKLELQTPKNYNDSHSISNEFGIYQLAYNAGIDINEITDFDKHKLESLYFKWLIAKNGLYENLPLEEKNDNNIFRNEIKLKGLTILGKIDLT
jgi:hypothetical protein